MIECLDCGTSSGFSRDRDGELTCDGCGVAPVLYCDECGDTATHLCVDGDDTWHTLYELCRNCVGDHVAEHNDAGEDSGIDYAIVPIRVGREPVNPDVVRAELGSSTRNNQADETAATGLADSEAQEGQMSTREENQLTQEEFEKLGKKIVVPGGMELRDASRYLARQAEADEQEVNVYEVIEGYPFDAALAFARTLEDMYGWTEFITKRSFFGSVPPTELAITIDADGETDTVAWGTMSPPGLEGELSTSIGMQGGTPVLEIHGRVRRKHRERVRKICVATRKRLEEDSIYKGKAIHVEFHDPGSFKFDPTYAPRFMKLNHEASDLVFPADTAAAIDASIFAPVRHTKACRKAGVPLKRGILLEGPYGVGKTLTAYALAAECEKHGWTFIYLDDLGRLSQAIEFASRYEPAVVFAEDLDRIVGSERSDGANELLNTIDGIDSKDRELMVILTTNNVEQIHPAMLRPGRLDAVISVRPPDAAAVEQLIRNYGRGLVRKTEDVSSVASLLASKQTIPAVVREVVERAKLAAIAHRGNARRVTGDDLLVSADSMLGHLDLLAGREPDERSDAEKAADIIGGHVAAAAAKFASKNGHSLKA